MTRTVHSIPMWPYQCLVQLQQDIPTPVFNVLTDDFFTTLSTCTILSFKKHLDSYMDKMGIEGYGPNVGNWD